MTINKKPIAVAVALIIAGFSIQITTKAKSVGDIVGGCMIFIGLIMFSISLHDILKKKPDSQNKNSSL